MLRILVPVAAVTFVVAWDHGLPLLQPEESPRSWVRELKRKSGRARVVYKSGMACLLPASARQNPEAIERSPGWEGVFDLLRILRQVIGRLLGWVECHSLPPPQPEGCDYISAWPAQYTVHSLLFPAALSFETPAARGQPTVVATLRFHAIRMAIWILSPSHLAAGPCAPTHERVCYPKSSPDRTVPPLAPLRFIHF